jgi:hypothetical protein
VVANALAGLNGRERKRGLPAHIRGGRRILARPKSPRTAERAARRLVALRDGRQAGHRRASSPLADDRSCRSLGRHGLGVVEIAAILAPNHAVEAVEPLAAALPRANVQQQEFLAESLCELGDPRAIPALITALEAHHGSYNLASNDIFQRHLGSTRRVRNTRCSSCRSSRIKGRSRRAESSVSRPLSLGCSGESLGAEGNVWQPRVVREP